MCMSDVISKDPDGHIIICAVVFHLTSMSNMYPLNDI